MPDLISPIAPPTIDIKDVDLNKAISTPQSISSPVSNSNIDWQSTVNLPGINTNNYQPEVQTFATERLKNVAGYNEFKSNPTFNPNTSDIANTRNYAAKQGKGEYAYNLGAKLFSTTADSFINTFGQNKRNIDALMNLDLDKLYSTDDNSKILEDQKYKYPTFGTGENDNTWLRFNPFTAGKSDFYGEFVPQLGFTLGTIGETVLENVAITALTGGLGGVAEVANDFTKFQKLFKGFNNLFESANGITNFKKSLQVINSIKPETGFLKALKAGEIGVASGIAGSNISSGAIKGAKLLANAYTMYNTAAGEASFEANNIYNQHFQELSQDFIDKNGYQPFGEDLQKIKNSSSSTAISTFGWNLPILLGSNLVQFGNILKPFKGAVAETVEHKALNLTGSKLAKTVTKAGEKEISSKLGKIFSHSSEFLKEAGSEGLEEVLQSYASTGSSSYYKDIYKGLSSGTALNKALSDIWDYTGSQSFQDDFFGGFIGGAVFSGVGKISEKTGLQERLGFNTDKSKEARKQETVNQAISILNETSNEDLVKYLFHPDVQNYVSQISNKTEAKAATEDKDQLKFNDVQDKSIRDLIYAGLQTGKLDIALSKLNIFKELDNDELAQALNIVDKSSIDSSKERATELVNTIKERAYSLQSDWNTLNQKYVNKYEKNSPAYFAFEEAKKSRLFAKDQIEVDRRKANKLRSDITSDTSGKVTSNILDQAIDDNLLSKQIEDLQYFIDNAPDKTDKSLPVKYKQLKSLREIEIEKLSKTPDYNKIAYHIFDIGEVNTPASNYFPNLFKESTLTKIADTLKLEDRNKINLAQYNLLNSRPIEADVANHLLAQGEVLSALRNQPVVDTTSNSTITTNQDNTTPNTSTTITEVPTTEETEEQKVAEENIGSQKLASIKFASDKTPPSEQLSTSNPADNQFHRRKDQFLENLHLNNLERSKGKFWNKNDVKVLIITPNNYTKYGKNLSSVLTNNFFTTKKINELSKEEYNQLDNASIMYLFVVEDNKELKPITVDGKLLSPLDGTSDYKIQDLVYSFNETSSPASYSSTRLQGNQTVDQLVQLHRNQRLKWLTSDENQLAPFEISHGLPNMEKKDGKTIRIQNTAQDVKLLNDNHIYQPDDLYISTSKDEFEKTNTNLLTDRFLRPGRPYLTIRDKQANIVDYQKLENNKLTANQKGSILYAFKSLINDFFDNEQLVELNDTNPNYNFIKNLLFLQESDPYKDKNSIKILQDVKEGILTIQYDFSQSPKFISFRKESNSDSIIDDTSFKTWLDNRYLNVRKPSTKKFTEIYVENKTPKTRLWDNYTQYLLDNKTPSGQTRDIAEIPLKVELYTPTQQEQYYEGGNLYPTQRKQYYVKLGLGKVIDDKANIVKQQTTTKPITNKQPLPNTGNKLADLAAVLERNKQAAEQKSNPIETKQETPKEEYTSSKNISLASLLSTPKEQVKEIVEETPPANDKLSELAEVLAANKAKATGQVIEQTSEIEVIEETPFTPDTVAPITEPEPEKVVSLRGKNRGNGKVYPRGFTSLSNYSKENIQEIKDYFKKNLPQISVETTNQLIKLADGKLAWGTFSGSTVKIFEATEAGTGYHEAFEVVYNGILSSTEQNNLLREFKNRKGTFSNFATDGNISYSKATDVEVREELAEEFLRYKLNGEIKEDTRNIFQKILDFILNFIRNVDTINNVFAKLDKGYYASSEIRNTNETYTRLAGIGAVEEGYYLKGITYEMISDLFSKTKSFTSFDEGFNEKKLYSDLYSQLSTFYNSDDENNPNTYKNVLADLYFPEIDIIENNPKFSEEYKQKLIRPLEVEYTKKLNAQREKFNTIISLQWDKLVSDHKTFLKQLGVISFSPIDDQENSAEGEQENKNSNEYVKNDFKIDVKNTAPASIKLLFNTIAESTFNLDDTQTLSNGLTIPLIQPKIVNTTGLVNLYDNGGELFNIVLSQVSEINTLDGIKAKLESILGIEDISNLQSSPEELQKYFQSRLDEEQYKNNSIYTHLFKLYTRIFATPENLLSEAEWKQRLKFLSTFSKQKPEFWQLVSGEDDTFMMDELRDTGRKQIISKWFYNFSSNIYDKKKLSLLNKQNKKSPYVLNQQAFDKLLALSDRNQFITKAATALGIEQINPAFIENITPNEQQALYNNLRTILNYGLSKIYNGKTGNKIFNRLDPNTLSVNSPYNEIAELVLSKQGDEVDSIHKNIEGEQQQNIILNNEISNRLASFNRHSTLQSYTQENPEFNDTFVKSSVLLNKLFDRNGNRTSFSPKVAVISGTRESSRDNGKKSSNQNLTERLYQEFNVNLDGKFYILLPADAETEWGMNVGRDIYLQYSDNVLSDLSPFMNYLRSEIEVAQQFVDISHPLNKNRTSDEYLSQIRPLRDGSERAVGASLQVFKDILSDGTVASIHENIDNLSAIDDIISTFSSQINTDIKNWINQRVDETFINLNRAEILERKDREGGQFDSSIRPNSNYIFYGLNSSFNRDVTKFPLNEGEVKRGKDTSIEKLPNQYVLTSPQVRNLVAFREMSYAMNNIEMTKLFVGNPYFYKDIQKRVKSFLSTTENTYTQNTNDIHKADNWFNQNLNKVNNELRLPSDHIHSHEFSSSIKAWVFKDHETLNKELSAFNEKYSANNATDAQSFITPNAYREFYWKSGAKFRENQEKQFQVEQAFERMLLDEDGIYPYTDSKLKAFDQKLLQGQYKETKDGYELLAKNDVFEVFKPKGSGTLGGLNTFDPYIWKTSVAFMNYRMVRNTPIAKAYIRMLQEKVNVLTFESAVKVGLKKDPFTNKVNSLISTDSFENLGKISDNLSSYTHQFPFKSVGLQVETSTQKSKGTIGTQTTKLILTDLFEYGIPTDFEKDNADFSEKMSKWYNLNEEQKLIQSKHYPLEKEHQKAIENLENLGYYNLLDRLGIKEVNRNGQTEYEYDDLDKVYQLLKEEMVKRGLSSNIYNMFDDLTLKVKPIEALSNYAQASFIIMSIVRKSIIKPKLNGGQKIQASSVLMNNLNSEGLIGSTFDKASNSWKDISTEEEFNQAKKDGSKIMYNSSQLKFYSKNEDGNLNVMEVMLPNVFREKLEKKRKALNLPKLSDEELLNWINKNQPKLLEGIGFRIPTQALSSIDTFKIKKFLPSYFGDTVVVPSELTTKVGSDFDVDKLNTYLNNFYVDKNGYPKYLQADLEETPSAANRRWKKYSAPKTILSIIDNFIQELTQRGLLQDRSAEALMSAIAEQIDEDERIEDILEQIDEEGNPEIIKRVLEANDFSLQDYETLQRKVDSLKSEEEFKAQPVVLQNRKGAIENNYFSIIDQILKLPQNFDKMLAPNNSDEFDKAGALRDKIMESLGGTKDNLEKIDKKKRSKYINYSNILDSNRMRYNRWAFVIGKKGVGIAALSATNHVNSQKIGFKLNPAIQSSSSWWNNKVFENTIEPSLIKFKHNKLTINEQEVSVLSGITKSEGENIAEFVSKYVNGYVDVAKDAWILDIGAQMEIAGIYLLMERLGINSEEIIYFLNQPVIKYYVNVSALKNSPIKNINPRVKEQVYSLNTDEKIYKQVQKLLIGTQTVKPVPSFKLSDLKSSIEKYSKYPLTNWKTNSQISVRDKEQQFLVFRHFLQLKDYSNYIRASQTASNHDTANLNSLHILDDKEQSLSSLNSPYVDKLITSIETNTPMAQALRDKTFVGNLSSKLDNIDSQFLSKDLFRIQARPVRKLLRSVMMKLKPALFSENDKREMMDKVTKVAMNSLILNSDLNNRGSLIDSLDKVMKTDNLRSILSKVQDIVKNPDETYKQQFKDANVDLAHIISNKWINQLQIENISPDSEFGYLSISGKKPSDNFEKQVWIEDFRKLKQLPFTQNLYKAILSASIYQAGAEHNRSSLLDLIPWQDYTPIINNGLDNISDLTQNNIARMIAQLKAFDKSYFTPKEYINLGEVNGRKFYAKSISLLGKSKDEVEVSKPTNLYSPSPATKQDESKPFWLPSVTHISSDGQSKREISSVILVPYSEYQNKQSYFTLRQQDSSYTTEEIKEMKEAKNYDFKTTILLEKAPLIFDNGLETYLIYRPINTKGNRYIQETTFNNDYSKLDTPEKVNPSLSNDDILFKLLSSKHPNNIKKTEEFPESPVIPIVEEDNSQETNTTEDIPFEEVPDENKELPNSQPLLENSTSENQENVVTSEEKSKDMSINFIEHNKTDYPSRTKINASADITIAIAQDFNTAGERLTKSSTINQGKVYFPVSTDVFASRNEIELIAGQIAQQINKLGKFDITINIAGNGIYTLYDKQTKELGFTPEMVQRGANRNVQELLEAVQNRLENKSLSIRSGGQTGYDEAGIKGAQALGLPTTILAPKGWTFRNVEGRDISNEIQFKARFESKNNLFSPDDLPSISPENTVEGSCE